MGEETLTGGFVNAVVRVGETVRRPPMPAYARRVLEFLAERDWPAAPRRLGSDELGRDVLTYVPGAVPVRGEDYVGTDAALAGVAELVRDLHDLTAGTALAAGGEVVCHNDLSPRNTVYRNALPVAILDWDIAGPGERIHDLAHVGWQFVRLGPGGPPPAEAARRLRVVADAYGAVDRSALVRTVLWWQDRCWRGIEERAAAGDPAMVRLRAGGGARDVRADQDWTAAHRATLEAAL